MILKEEKKLMRSSSLCIPQSQLHHTFFGSKIRVCMLKISRFTFKLPMRASSFCRKTNFLGTIFDYLGNNPLTILVNVYEMNHIKSCGINHVNLVEYTTM